MDGQTCDKHPSARAAAKVTFPSGMSLYLCGHCCQTLALGADFLIEYEAITV